MRALVIVCHPDEPPHIEDIQTYEPPDGCDGWMVIVNGEGMPCMVPMPCNQARPDPEKYSDYLVALTVAETFLRYRKVSNEKRLDVNNSKLLNAEFGRHIESCIERVGNHMLDELNFSEDELNALVKMGFLWAHDRCCPDEDCKHEMHDKLYPNKA